jgi:hypothetical protein
LNFCGLAEQMSTRYAGKMGSLKYPFMAASAALFIAGLILGPHLFWRWAEPMQLALGLLLGGLASVVVYGIMRTFAARR